MCTTRLKFSANRKRVGQKFRYHDVYQNRSSRSNVKALTFDFLVRNYAMNMQREGAYAWGLMVVLQGYLAYA